MEKEVKVKSGTAAQEASLMTPSSLRRHGGLLREQSDTIRVRRGRWRCPECSLPLAACSPAANQHNLPLWNLSLERYLELVGTHGLPEGDRPDRCPTGCPCERAPHRHSHYWRSVFTSSSCQRICIFRFRCPDCGYVHSVIPAFLDPYQRLALDLQEQLVDAVQQGATLETVAESSEALPGGPVHEKTIGRLIRGWNERLTQLESGLWVWLLQRAPHLTFSRSASLWTQLRGAWQAIRGNIPAFREVGFLHGLHRLCFSLAVTVHG